MKLIITDIDEETQSNVLDKRFKPFTHVVYALIFLFLVSCSATFTLEEIKEPITIEKKSNLKFNKSIENDN